MKPSRWKGLLASLILPEPEQLFQGRLKPALAAFVTSFGSAPIIILLLVTPLLPPMAAVLFILLCWMACLYFWADAWRPTPPIGWKKWALIIVVSITLYEVEKAVVLSAFKIYSIPTTLNSMSPTIQGGDVVFCLRGAYGFEPLRRGDIVVFPHQGSAGESFTWEKRLVGLPGDVLEFKSGALLVNGIPYRYPGQKNDYAPKPAEDSDASSLSGQPFTVPLGMIYVLGDNPSRSLDSRFFGDVPLDSVIAKVTVILWPFNRAQRISN